MLSISYLAAFYDEIQYSREVLLGTGLTKAKEAPQETDKTVLN
jgi:hypothetical protein